MGRGRGKGKKISTSNHDDAFEEEEKVPVQKRRGRPQKLLKEAFDEEEAEKVEEEEDGEDAKSGITMKEPRSPIEAEHGNKRKRNVQVKGGKPSLVKEENGGEARSSTEDSSKPNGFRHDGSRRKSKPRRAAEVGVECK